MDNDTDPFKEFIEDSTTYFNDFGYMSVQEWYCIRHRCDYLRHTCMPYQTLKMKTLGKEWQCNIN